VCAFFQGVHHGISRPLTVVSKIMAITKIDHSGTSQSVRLREGFHFDADEVEIRYRGDEIVLRKRPMPSSLTPTLQDQLWENKDWKTIEKVRGLVRSESVRCEISLLIRSDP